MAAAAAAAAADATAAAADDELFDDSTGTSSGFSVFKITKPFLSNVLMLPQRRLFFQLFRETIDFV